MKIQFFPQRRDTPLIAFVAGDVLTIDGEAFDFSSLPDGGEIPHGEIPCDMIAGSVIRSGGMLTVPLIAPYGPVFAGQFVDTPSAIDTGGGPVEMPFADSWEAPQ